MYPKLSTADKGNFTLSSFSMSRVLQRNSKAESETGTLKNTLSNNLFSTLSKASAWRDMKDATQDYVRIEEYNFSTVSIIIYFSSRCIYI